MDLIAPVLVLIAACIFGMVYTGGFFEGVDFITAFADCSASVGLVMGSAIALMFTFVFYRVRGVMTFQDFAACIPEASSHGQPHAHPDAGMDFPAVTGLLGAKYYVASLLSGSAAALQYLLPIIIFVVAVFLAFATGTSWGTFSILVPSSAMRSRMVRCWWSPSPPACPARSAATTARPSPTPPSWPLPARTAAT